MLGRGVAPAEMARRMGTSIAMLDAHYFHGAEIEFKPVSTSDVEESAFRDSVLQRLPIGPREAEQFVSMVTDHFSSTFSTSEIDRLMLLLRDAVKTKTHAELAELHMELFTRGGPTEVVKTLLSIRKP